MKWMTAKTYKVVKHGKINSYLKIKKIVIYIMADAQQTLTIAKPTDKFIAEAQKRLLVFVEVVTKAFTNLIRPFDSSVDDEQQNTEQCPPRAQ